MSETNGKSKMRVHNVIVVYDVYAVAETPESARAAILGAIASNELQPSDQNAIPVNHERSIREQWRTEKPFVGEDVSDADFERCKGKTTLDIFNMLHTKPPADPNAKPAKK